MKLSELEPKVEPATDRKLFDRRDFLTTTGSVLASLGVWDRLAHAQPRPGQAASLESTEEVETPICQLRLDRRNGNLIGLTWKNPFTEVIVEPRLGENFRILFPQPGHAGPRLYSDRFLESSIPNYVTQG